MGLKNRLDFWVGKFGDEYTKRNELTDADIASRVGLWTSIFNSITTYSSSEWPKSVLEIGAGNGINMHVLDQFIKPSTSGNMDLYATEPNDRARGNLVRNANLKHSTSDHIHDLSFKSASKELVFTSGVLIHIPPEGLLKAMSEVFRVSSKYVACIEYFSPTCREVEYRGEKAALWANDFGGMYLDNFPLRLLNYGFYWKRTTGLDNLTAWLFEKVN